MNRQLLGDADYNIRRQRIGDNIEVTNHAARNGE